MEMIKDDEVFEFTLPIGLKVADADTVLAIIEPAKTEEAVEVPVIPAGNVQENVFDSLFANTEASVPEIPLDEFTEAAQELGLQLPEGAEKWTRPLLVEQAKFQIETSKQQLDLTQYDPEIKLLFDYVHESGGSLMGLPVDPVIRELNELTNYNPEYFFRKDYGQRIMDEGLADNDDDTDNLVEQRISRIPEIDREKFFEDYHAKKIREEVMPAIMQRVQELNTEKQTYRDRLKLVAQAEESKVADSMIRTIQNTKNFVGIEFSQKTIETVVAKIKSGEIQKAISKDPGKYQVLGYLTETLGPNATKVYKDILDKRDKSQYYEGVRSQLDLQLNVKKDNGEGNVDASIPLNDWGRLRSVTGG